MSAKLFLFYLRFRKPIILISGAIALILVSLNTWFEYQIHLNTWMLEKGMAKLGSNFTQCRSDEELELALAIAQKGKLGIWKTR